MTLDECLLAYKDGRLSEQALREHLRMLKAPPSFVPLSEGQQGLWVEHRLARSASGYNIALALVVPQTLDIDLFRRACARVCEQHPMLGVTISEQDGQLRQRMSAASSPGFAHEDWSGRQMDDALAYLKQHAKQPFALEVGPLLRVLVLSLRSDRHLVLFVVHHVVFDGASWPVLLSSLLDAYDTLLRGQPWSPPRPKASYQDFVEWEQAMLAGKAAASHRAYWQQQLAGPLPILRLPLDRPRSSRSTAQACTHAVAVEPGLAVAVKAACRTHRVNAASYFLALYQWLLHRYTDADDIIVGMPTMGRPEERFESVIGYFVNMLAIRGRIDGGETFADLVRRAHATVVDGIDHGAYPFTRIVQDVNASREHAPIFQVVYGFENSTLFAGAARPAPARSGLRLEPIESISRDVEFGDYQLALEVCEQSQSFDLRFKYDRAVFDDATIARMASHYVSWLERALADPDAPMESHSSASADELATLAHWNDTAAAYARDAALHELFEAQVARTPDAPAIEDGGQRLTYAELDRRANVVARRLRHHGVGSDGLVGIFCERSIDFVVAILGTLKAGAGYLPLDPEYPQARTEYMLSDSAPRIVITQQHLMSALPATGAAVMAIDRASDDELPSPARSAGDARIPRPSPHQLAYVIYTSGSTGTPKGIAMPQRVLVNLIEWHRRHAVLSRPQRTLHFAALGFDVSAQEVFATLCVGGTLLVIDEAVRREPRALAETLRDRAAQRLFLTPSALQNLAEAMRAWEIGLPSLEDVVTAGEALTLTPAITQLFRRLPSARLHNHYGPAECHVVTTTILSGDPDEWRARPAIGRPISNVGIHILDEKFQPVPIGIVGEIYVGGDAVSRGYLNRPELTQERFLPDPFSASTDGRLYKTNDRGRWRSDGEIEYLGRSDDQVKIRGYRIEPGEIAAQLMRHELVRHAAVVAREDVPGDRRLVAYLTAAGGEAPTTTGLRGFLRRTLPEYMIPAAFVTLESLPLTRNGKVDTRALPAPPVEGDTTVYEPPQGALEASLAVLWRDLLHVERIGRHGNFFEMGGHSLLGMQLIVRMREELGVDVPLKALFEHQTLAALAAHLARLEQTRQLSFRRPSTGSEQRQRGVI